MNASAPGWVVFERIRCDIESGAAHWIERDIGCRPFRWEPGRKRADDDEGGGDDWGDAGDVAASAPRIRSRGK